MRSIHEFLEDFILCNYFYFLSLSRASLLQVIEMSHAKPNSMLECKQYVQC